MDLDLPDFKDTKSFKVGLRELIYSFSAVYPTSKIAEIVFTQPRPITEQACKKRPAILQAFDAPPKTVVFDLQLGPMLGQKTVMP